MATKVFIPTALRRFAGNQEFLELPGGTVQELLQGMVSEHAELKKHLFTDDGKLRSFVNIYVNDEDIRSLSAEKTPIKNGDTVMIVPSIAGGAPYDFNQEEILRYSRHLIMPEVGIDGQAKLKKAKVLCVGTGGLGSPCTTYLAAAGVGTIGIVDFDNVDSTNLHRQILFTQADIGRPKLEAARDRLRQINPHVNVNVHEGPFRSDNALSIARGYDMIVDGTDNYPTRYLCNDVAVFLGIPNVYASIFRFEGQISIFYAKEGPCYRCLYPEPPPPGLVPSCAEGGVLGVLPGIVGSLQALEAIKLVIGGGRPTTGRLILFDALQMSFRELKLRKNPACPVCGPNATIKEPIDYEQFCGIAITGEEANVDRKFEVTATELKEMLGNGSSVRLLDVREPGELKICGLPGAMNIPLNDVPQRVAELDTADDLVVFCHMGVRSAKALAFLKQVGFRKLRHLKGGIDAWSRQVDPSVPRY